MGTKIEWTEFTWNPVIGCSKISDGCQNCYAEKMAVRLSRIKTTDYYGAVVGGKKWNGKTALVESALTKPMHWRKPRKIFVCSMSDLFHESVPDAWIDKVFAVMALCPQHTFQVLTKRPERMREYLGLAPEIRMAEWGNQATQIIHDKGKVASMKPPWPLKHVWLGTTVESQPYVQSRVLALLGTPAAVRFVSVEPMLSLTILKHIRVGRDHINALTGTFYQSDAEFDGGVSYDAKLDWVICGGESGPNARPMNPDWARSLRDQCEDARVPFFFKQMSKKAEIPDDLKVREFPRVEQ